MFTCITCVREDANGTEIQPVSATELQAVSARNQVAFSEQDESTYDYEYSQYRRDGDRSKCRVCTYDSFDSCWGNPDEGKAKRHAEQQSNIQYGDSVQLPCPEVTDSERDYPRDGCEIDIDAYHDTHRVGEDERVFNDTTDPDGTPRSTGCQLRKMHTTHLGVGGIVANSPVRSSPRPGYLNIPMGPWNSPPH
eukprot:gnl/MRDRNA2_/MRDRNA2_57336_c0_seq1.p1 gnl/MRDRNA2_/MRDRNA2_57336_c0~~gnl/MRDRNA2_/MRDRNA2_57336_c0_seq1.p1  ORF type:complete len:193 (+),score=28.62 gnl/MRDRNA2_/MRDRNA2_57336_c0_seq1:92-670(+)